jgi:hypothetical protein
VRAALRDPFQAIAGFVMKRAPILIAVAVLLAFAEVLGPDRGLFFRDHVLVYKPMWFSAWAQLHEGQWPVLNFGHPSGMPMETSVAAGLYTPATLLLLGDFDLIYDWFVVFHFLVAGFGAFVLARNLGAGQNSAIAVGLISALSGPVFSFENLLVGLIGIAYAPWVAFGFLRVLDAPTPRSAGLLAIAIAFQLQAMMPELVLLDALLCAAIVGARRPRIGRTLVGSLAAAATVAVLLAAVDLGPLFEGLSGTARAGGFAYDERAGWSLSGLQLIELLAPSFWAPPDLAYFNVPAATGSISDPPYLISLYFGAALPLALVAPWWRDRRARWIAAATILFFLVAAGGATPLHGLLSRLPLLSSGRYAIKYLLFASAGVAALSAFTITEFEVRAKRVLIVSISLGAMCLAARNSLAWPETRELLAAAAKPLKSAVPFELFTSQDVIAPAIDEMRSSLLHGILACAGLALLSLVSLRTRGHWVPTAVVVLLAIDLAAASVRSLPSAPVDSTKLPDRALALLGDRTIRVHVENAPPIPVGGGTPFEAQTAHRGVHGMDPNGRFRTVQSLDVDAQRPTIWDRILVGATDLEPRRFQTLLARAGARYDLRSSRADDPIALEYQDGQGTSIFVYENPNALAHQHLATRWRTVAKEALLASLSDPALLDEAIVGDAPRDLALSATGTTCRARLEKLEDRFERASSRIQSPCPTLLVFQEIARPRWRASLDGKPVEFATVDLGFVAVPVPPGDHSVEIEYASATRSWAPFSLLGILLLTASLAAPGWHLRGRPTLDNTRRRTAKP